MEALALLLGAFGMTSALWSLQLRSWRRNDEQRTRQLATWLDADAQVAVALAKHTAAQRHQPFAPIHVLFAVVQAEPVVAAIETLGGNPAALESAVDDALDKLEPGGDPRDGSRMLGVALAQARAQEREMTLADALQQIARTPAAALLDAPPVSLAAVMFHLVHGDPPPVSLWGELHVNVVIRNDNYSNEELVVMVLRDVFELTGERAQAVTRKAHEDGKAIVGRFAADTAKAKVLDARRRAAEYAAPLWVGVEIC